MVFQKSPSGSFASRSGRKSLTGGHSMEAKMCMSRGVPETTPAEKVIKSSSLLRCSFVFWAPRNQIFLFFWFSCFFRGVCFSEAVFHFFWKVFCIYGCPNVSLVSHGPKISLKRIVISPGVLLVTKPLGATSKNPMLLPCLNHILLPYFCSMCEAGRLGGTLWVTKC